MYRFILFWALVLLLAAPAFAINTTKYPSTIVDETCTDSNDVPAAYTPGLTHIGGGGQVVAPAALVQLTGSADGYCDHDSRIRTGALVADSEFGPFSLGPGYSGVFMFAYATAVVHTDTGTWDLELRMHYPHSGAALVLDTVGEITAEGGGTYALGYSTVYTSGGVADEWDTPLPDPFYVRIDLLVATSWTGSVSFVPFR